MSNITLSKSAYCKGIQCPKMLWLDRYKKDEFDDSVMNQMILEAGNEIGDFAMGLFGDFVEVPRDTTLPSKKAINRKMIEITNELIAKNTPVICEASFDYDGCFCSVDILKNKGNREVELYEVKSSTDGIKKHEIYFHEISYQTYVLTKLGFNVTKACLVHPNNTYVRMGGEIEMDKYFNIVDLTAKIVKPLNFANVERNIKFFKAILSGDEPKHDLSEDCYSPYVCGFKKYCTRNLPHPNVFDLNGGMANKTKLKLYHEGIISFEDLDCNAKLNRKQEFQIRHELDNLGNEVNAPAIQQFLNKIYFPVYHLDFESVQTGLPLYENNKAYEQVPFQYSLHIQDAPHGKIRHKEFLATGKNDPRYALAKKLVKDIPTDVCVLAYNSAFEKGIIRRLIEVCEDDAELCEKLRKIHDNIIDLAEPFRNFDYYNKDMVGKYSIKYVLPALYPNCKNLDYHNLKEVHNGTEAIRAYKKLSKVQGDDYKSLRKNMLKYCKLDTFAMVKVLDRLYEAVE